MISLKEKIIGNGLLSDICGLISFELSMMSDVVKLSVLNDIHFHSRSQLCKKATKKKNWAHFLTNSRLIFEEI